MKICLQVCVIILTAIAMEGFAWATHKYLMHGFLWFIHKSHHSPRQHWWEANDIFAVFFTLQSIAFIVVGWYLEQWSWLFPIGVGIALYGILYAIFHDVLAHNRIPFLRFKISNPYLKRIIRAHGVHHRYHSKEGGEAFGFLYAPAKYDAQQSPPVRDEEKKRNL
jgi:beta-carotene 3-hydroxylase